MHTVRQHLSLFIYLACLALFLLVTACSDNKVLGQEFQHEEWKSKHKEYSVNFPCIPVSFFTDYSGRITVAHRLQTWAHFLYEHDCQDQATSYVNLYVYIRSSSG